MSRRIFRWSGRDAWLVGAAAAHGALLVAALALLPNRALGGAAIAALGCGLLLVWCSNTVAHNHLHNPLFRSPALNRALSIYLSVVCALPQSVWRARHFWHHAGEPERGWRLPRAALLEIACIGLVWGAVGSAWPHVIVVVAGGTALGMGLCRLQGAMEHSLEQRPERGTSHYGALHNWLWFNDGYHAEHHRWPGLHWTRLPERRSRIDADESPWPPLLRWLPALGSLTNRAQGVLLGWLERLPLAFGSVRQLVLDTHERAFARLLAQAGARPGTVGIIGGGLFPRTLIVLRRLLPEATLIVVDRSAQNVERAQRFLRRSGLDLTGVEFRVEPYDPERHQGFDLLVAPLGFVGDRGALSAGSDRALLVTHDWIWHAGGEHTTIVSYLLLKRMSLHRAKTRTSAIVLPEAA
jgi:hypothetical protein